METKQLSAEQMEQLRKPLPSEAVKQHPTKTFLSTIKAIYVVERLNEVFGIGRWHLKSEIIDNKTAMIVVRSVLTVPEYGIELESFGGNDNGGENSKGHDLGDAYKGATTDALTKICSYLEIGMDVFKGKQGSNPPAARPQGAQVNGNGEEKPWLNEDSEMYRSAVLKLKSGSTTVEKIETVFKLSKAIKAKLSEIKAEQHA